MNRKSVATYFSPVYLVCGKVIFTAVTLILSTKILLHHGIGAPYQYFDSPFLQSHVGPLYHGMEPTPPSLLEIPLYMSRDRDLPNSVLPCCLIATRNPFASGKFTEMLSVKHSVVTLLTWISKENHLSHFIAFTFLWFLFSLVFYRPRTEYEGR